MGEVAAASSPPFGVSCACDAGPSANTKPASTTGAQALLAPIIARPSLVGAPSRPRASAAAARGRRRPLYHRRPAGAPPVRRRGGSGGEVPLTGRVDGGAAAAGVDGDPHLAVAAAVAHDLVVDLDSRG